MLVFRVTLDPDDIRNVRGQKRSGRAGPLELPPASFGITSFLPDQRWQHYYTRADGTSRAI